MADTINCPGCGMPVELSDAKDMAEHDENASLTCPTCGAGFDRDGKLVHDPVIGP